jgi:ferredoxin
VTVVCLEKREEMPAWSHEIEAALEEGVEVINAFGPVKVLQESGRVSGIEFKRCTAVFDDNGAFKPRFDDTDLMTLSADTAIVAIGQARNPPFEVHAQKGSAPAEGETDIAAVYACGDLVSGPTTVVQAMASARRVAGMIIRRFTSSEVPLDRGERETLRDEYEPIPKGMPTEPRRPVPQRRVSERIKDMREVNGPYSTQEAMKEASRCLQCGLCSECLQCERVCDLGAIEHHRTEARTSLRFDGIVVCDERQVGEGLHRLRRVEVAEQSKRDSWAKAVVAGRAVAMAAAPWSPEVTWPTVPQREAEPGDMKAGVFICSCNGTLNEDGRLDDMVESLQTLPGVAHGEVLVSACHPEKGRRIEKAMEEKGLNCAVIASCTCCHFDFACESCTDQRIRLKHRLFRETGWHPASVALVNIKETCLVPFKEDPERGGKLAERMIRSGLSQLKESRASVLAGARPWPQALVLGASEAGIAAALGLKGTCPSVAVVEPDRVPKPVEKLLSDQGIRLMCPVKPVRLEGPRGHLTVVVETGDVAGEGARNNKISAGLIILGRNEFRNIPYRRDAFGRDFHARPARAFGTLETGIPGVYLASWPQAKTLSQAFLGLGASSEALEGALGARHPKGYLVAEVDPELCRGCGRCADICPEGAAHLEETARGAACSVIDSSFCTGCGNCLAECPTGAIHMPECEQEDYKKVIHALLG